MPPLRLAISAFTATADARANARIIATAIDTAARRGAAVLLTPECALCGYPPATGHPPAPGGELAGLEAELFRQAAACGITVVLGSAGRDGDAVLDQVVVGGTAASYRQSKRQLTPSERGCFAPGSGPAPLLGVGGWQLAIGICYEIRQAAWWYAAAASGADAALVLAHQAGRDIDPGCKAEVLPALHAARAAELAMPVALANTAAPDRWLDSAAWDARGRRMDGCGEGLLCCELVHRSALDPWYATVRSDALAAWRRAGAER